MRSLYGPTRPTPKSKGERTEGRPILYETYQGRRRTFLFYNEIYQKGGKKQLGERERVSLRGKRAASFQLKKEDERRRRGSSTCHRI